MILSSLTDEQIESRQKELSMYRLEQAKESLNVAKNCIKNNFYKDAVRAARGNHQNLYRCTLKKDFAGGQM